MDNKRYAVVCLKHEKFLVENENHTFVQDNGDNTFSFDDDNVDLSGFMCPQQTEVDDCQDYWEAADVDAIERALLKAMEAERAARRVWDRNP